MKETIRLALILFLITAISAFILSVSNRITVPIIAEADAIKNQEAKESLLEGTDEFKEVDQETMDILKSKNPKIEECDIGLSKGEEVGYVFKTSSTGYGGDIEFMMSITLDGRMKGIEILNHEETPGLGANITRDSFKTSFEGKAVEGGLSAVKEPSQDYEVQAITSATITTDAIVDEVNRVIDAYKEISNTDVSIKE